MSQEKHITTIILDKDLDRLLDRAARERGVSRSEFIRAQLRRVLDQFREHPRPRSAGSIKTRLHQRGDEHELFQGLVGTPSAPRRRLARRPG